MLSATHPSLATHLLTKWTNFLDIIKLNLKFRKTYQANDSISYLIKNIKKEQTIVCFGSYTLHELLLIKKALGSSGRLVVFVPDSATKIQLCKVVQVLGWLNVTIELLQYSDRVGENIADDRIMQEKLPKEAAVIDINDSRFEKLHQNTRSGCSTSFRLPESLVVDVLHLKIEVNNLKLLHSIESIIKKSKPSVVVEYEVSKTDKNFFYKAIGYLTALQYRGFFILDTLNIPLANFDFDIYQNPLSNFYCNTFVFKSR